MGMFDYVRCDAPLPPDGRVESGLFQTKDHDCQLDTLAITEDGRLVHESGWDGSKADLEFDGILNFYGGPDGTWEEYNAAFVRGQLLYITPVPDEQ